MNWEDEKLALPIQESCALIATSNDLDLVEDVELVRRWADQEILAHANPEPGLLDLCEAENLRTAREHIDLLVMHAPNECGRYDKRRPFPGKEQLATDPLWRAIWHAGHAWLAMRQVRNINDLLERPVCCAPPNEVDRFLWDEVPYEFPVKDAVCSGVFSFGTARLLGETVEFLENLRIDLLVQGECGSRGEKVMFDTPFLLRRLSSGESIDAIERDMVRIYLRSTQVVDAWPLVVSESNRLQEAAIFEARRQELRRLLLDDLVKLVDRVCIDREGKSRG